MLRILSGRWARMRLKQARVYDGSMARWSRNADLPMDRKVSMKE